MRAERHLLRLGEYLVSRACQALPPDTREERRREWAAELPAILHDPQVRFAPLRAACMLAYAADTLRGTAMKQGPIARWAPAFNLLSVIAFLVEVVLSIWAIAQAPGNGQNYLQLTWGLLAVALFTSRLVHAPERTTTPLMFSTALVLEGPYRLAGGADPKGLVERLLGNVARACPSGRPGRHPPGSVVPQTPGRHQKRMIPSAGISKGRPGVTGLLLSVSRYEHVASLVMSTAGTVISW